MAVVIGWADGCACTATFECGFAIVATWFLHPGIIGRTDRVAAVNARVRNVLFILFDFWLTEFEANLSIRHQDSHVSY